VRTIFVPTTLAVCYEQSTGRLCRDDTTISQQIIVELVGTAAIVKREAKEKKDEHVDVMALNVSVPLCGLQSWKQHLLLGIWRHHHVMVKMASWSFQAAQHRGQVGSFGVETLRRVVVTNGPPGGEQQRSRRSFTT
jgi:hypothetical protein